LMRRAADLGIADRFEWHGQVPRQRVFDLFDHSHLHVITGLNEANTTSIWEALGRSVPVLTLDHCGMHDVIAPAYGISIPVTQVEQSSRDIAVALQALIDAPERLEAMARAIATDCDRFRIVHRPRTFLDAYDAAISRYRERTAG
jgi:glycosyltransferase involved in cell wall biosynthesis